MKFSKIPRIYIKQSISENQDLCIEGDDLYYITSVMRLRENEHIRLFNENSGELLAKIVTINKKQITLRCESKLKEGNAFIADLTLAIGIIRPERFLMAIKGATQLGVTKIVPLKLERSQNYALNFERLEKCLIEESEQSERISLPKMLQPSSLDKIDFNNKKIIFANELENKKYISGLSLSIKDDIILIIGSEGGFTAKEIDFISALPNSASVTLGQTVLRTEIAAISAIACINMIRNS